MRVSSPGSAHLYSPSGHVERLTLIIPASAFAQVPVAGALVQSGALLTETARAQRSKDVAREVHVATEVTAVQEEACQARFMIGL
jgi:hypothetical protein